MAVTGTPKNIAYAVTFKAAVDLVASGVVELETEDIGAELIGLTDVIFDQYITRLDDEGSRKAGPKPAKKRSTTSRKGGYSPNGSRPSSGGASPKAVHYALDLLANKDHDLDVEADDVEGMDGKEVSALIDELKGYADID